MPNNRKTEQDKNPASKKSRILEAIQILNESDFAALIEKNPQTLSSFNIFEKAKLSRYLKKYPDNEIRKDLFNTLYYMTEPEKMIRTAAEEFIQYCNRKLLPPNKISGHKSWLKILNTALKSCSNEQIKNQLLSLMGHIERSRHNLDLAKKYYLAMTSPQGVVPVSNLSNDDFIDSEAKKLEKLQAQKSRLEQLYASRENEGAVVLLRGLSGTSVKQGDEKVNDEVFLNVEKSWNKADEAAYQQTLEELEHKIQTLHLNALINRDENGNTKLLFAVTKDPGQFPTLIENTSAAALNIALPLQNIKGYTALHYAARNKDPAMFKALVEKASPATLNKMLSMQNQDGHSLLSCALMNEDSSVFLALVEKVGTDALNKALPVKSEKYFDHHYGFTALHWALINSDPIVLQTLVKKASPAVLNKIFSSRIFLFESFLESAARMLRYKDPHTFAALIEKSPQDLAFLNSFSKDYIKDFLREIPNIETKHRILKIFHYMTEPEKMIRTSPAELIQFFNSKILPPNSMDDPNSWLKILNKTLKYSSKSNKLIKNQLHGLMAYIEMSRNNSDIAKKHCLAITSPEGLPPAINLLVADFVGSEGRGLEGSKKNTALLKLQHEKKHLEHLHLAVISENKVEANEPGEQKELRLKSADHAKDLLRIMLGRDSEQGPWTSDEEKNDAEALSLDEVVSLEDSSKASETDEAVYMQKLEELKYKIEALEKQQLELNTLTKKDRNGNTKLLLAVMNKDPRQFHALIETTSAAALNIALSLQNRKGYTALHYAANKNPEMFKTLVEKASPATLNNMLSMQDHDGYSLLASAIKNNDPSVLQTLVKKVSTDALNKALTVQSKTKVTATLHWNYGFNALWLALWKPDPSALQILVEKASPAVLNKIFIGRKFFLEPFLVSAARVLKYYPSTFAALIEKAPQGLAFLNESEKESLKEILESFPDNEIRKNILNTVRYMTEFERIVRYAPGAVIQFFNSKILPPNIMNDHDSWLKILDKTLKASLDLKEVTKNQLHGLMAYIEMSRNNSDSAKKHCLPITSPKGLPPTINLILADFVGLEGNKKDTELGKLQYEKTRLEILHYALTPENKIKPNETREQRELRLKPADDAKDSLRIMLGRDPKQDPWNSDEEKNDAKALSLDEAVSLEDSWSKADEAVYKQKLEELEYKIEALEKQQLELDNLIKQDRKGETALHLAVHLAVWKKDPRQFHTLIETTSAAALDIALPLQNLYGSTALHYASLEDDTRIFKTLVEKASPATLNKMISIQDQFGCSVLSAAVAKHNNPTVLQALVEKVSTDALNKALAVPSKTNEELHWWHNPLWAALWRPNPSGLQTLVEKASPAVLNKIITGQRLLSDEPYLVHAARSLKGNPSAFAALIEKVPQGLAFLNESEKKSLKEHLNSFPDNKIKNHILNTVNYMTELEKSVRNSPAKLMQFLNSKILPPHSIGDHDLWLTILNKTLKTASNQADEVTKNQLRGLMAYIEISRNNGPSAKKYCLAITSPEGLPPAINLLVADFVLSEGRGLEGSKKNTALLKLQHEKKHLEHLHLAVISENKVEPPNENSEQRELQLKSADSAKDFLRIMLGRDSEQGPRNSDEEKNDAEDLSLDEAVGLEDSWNKADEAVYKQKLNELDQKIKQAESKKFKIPSWSLFGKSKKDDDKKQKIEAAIAVTAPPKAGSKK